MRLAAVQYSGGNCGSQWGCDTIREMYAYSPAGGVTGKRLRVIRSNLQGDLQASWTYDNEGRVTGVTYPSWYSNTTVPGSSYTYGYDNMGRLNTMTDQLNAISMVTGITYGVASEMQQLTGAYFVNKDRIHDVKVGIGAGPGDWVGIDPDGNVWTGSPDGTPVNHGPWGPYTHH